MGATAVIVATAAGCGDRTELRRCRDVRAELAKENAALRAREQAQKTLVERLARKLAEKPAVVAHTSIDVPKSSASKPVTNIQLRVDKHGKLFLDGKAVAQAALKGALVARHKRQPDARVLVSADPGAPYKHIVKLLDLAKAAGFSRLGFVTRPSP